MESSGTSLWDKILEFRLLLIDASASMNDKLEGVPKIQMINEGLKKFYLEVWPLSYPDYPVKVGALAFNTKGFREKPNFIELIPLLVTPTPSHLDKIDELKPAGGTPIYDALKYAFDLIKSAKPFGRSAFLKWRISLIGDGGNEGPDPTQLCREIAKSGIVTDAIEFSDVSSSLMLQIAVGGEGRHYLVKNSNEFLKALQGHLKL